MLAGMRALAVVVALCASTVAHAESRAWTAAKKVLPAGSEMIGGANVTTLRGSGLFATLWPLVAQKSPGISVMVDKLKAECGLDVLQQIDSLVMAGSADSADEVAFVVALKTTQKDVEQCMVKVDKAANKPLAIGKDGAYTKYTEDGSTAYVRWLDKSTLVATLRASDKDLLTKMTAGGIAKDPAIAHVKTDAALWIALDKAADLDALQTKMTRAYGSADVKGGTVSVNAHLVLPDAAAAKSVAGKANDQLDAAKKSGAVPPSFAWLVKSLAITAAGNELVINATGAESDVLDLVKAASQ
jgi:hypothetical protein